VPPKDRGLLARLDALVALVADHHGLVLLPDGRLAAAEAKAAAQAVGLGGSSPAGPTTRPGGRGRTAERDAVELLRCVGEGVGLLRARGERLEATGLRHAWAPGVHWSGCGPGMVHVMLRSLDPSDGLVVKSALPTIQIAEENDRSSAWSLVCSSAGNVSLWPPTRGAAPVLEHLEGAF